MKALRSNATLSCSALVLEPEKVAPDSVSGEGDSPYRYVATVVLSTEV